MKVLILEEYYKGNDALQVLVDAVWEGALAAGHEARILEVNDYTLIPCHGCLMCGFDSPCVLSDDMDDLKEEILKADAVVFASSPTDRGLSPQLFALASRFIYFTQELRRKKLRSALISAAPEPALEGFSRLLARYTSLTGQLALSDRGRLLVPGCRMPEDLTGTEYLEKANALGRGL